MPYTIPRKKKPHTNIDNEITGAYYEKTTYKLRWPAYVLLVLGLIITLAIVDLFFSETVTEVISELFV